jgi:16S rRNA (cytosine967-C5)-methyltransferase
MAEVTPARKIAFQILLAVEKRRAHADDLLRRREITSLSVQNRNLATALVLGVLRWQIRLDHEVQSHLARPNARLDPEVRIALRLGAFQLRHLDRIPVPAAIDESVELAKQAGHRFASRMVNAVLRKIAAEQASPLPETTPSELALAQAHPEWLVQRWARFYGLDAARSICLHGQSQPPLSIRVESLATEQEIVDEGVKLEPGELLQSVRTIVSGAISATTAFREGRVRFQDEGSQLVAEIAGNANAILDCCAAPGGKTLILAERNPGAHIVACEANQQRLAELTRRLAPHREHIECRHADAAALNEQDRYDLALADVPCSGTGTLGRNPEIRHRLRPDDLPRQADRQRAILRAALQAVRPGGRVVYSTCSLEPEENDETIAAVLAELSNVRLVSLRDRIDEMLRNGILTHAGAEGLQNCITPEGYLRLLPALFHTDGFFVALLQKQS